MEFFTALSAHAAAEVSQWEWFLSILTSCYYTMESEVLNELSGTIYRNRRFLWNQILRNSQWTEKKLYYTGGIIKKYMYIVYFKPKIMIIKLYKSVSVGGWVYSEGHITLGGGSGA